MLRMTDEIGYVWQRVARDVERRIESGELPPGSMLRGERSMAEEYGVAIDTVRRAVKDLRERGIVVTLPAKGTFVAPRADLWASWREPVRRAQDASGCVLISPDQPHGIPLTSPRMTEDDEGPRRIPLRNSEWRYVQVADDLEARIRAGEFPFDARLPRREDLAAEYGVGEMTVRHALRTLAERGLVRPMASVGTVVIWTVH